MQHLHCRLFKHAWMIQLSICASSLLKLMFYPLCFVLALMVVVCEIIFKIVRYCVVFGCSSFTFSFLFSFFFLFLFSWSISIPLVPISLFYYFLHDGFVFLVLHVDRKGLLPVSGAITIVKKISCHCLQSKS